MMDKDLYDSYKSRMELYMQNREHGRMILESVEHGPLIWPTIEENKVIRTKKYAELSAAEKIQADCDMKATNIILQAIASLRFSSTNNQHRTSSNLRNQATIQDGSVTVQQVKGRQDPGVPDGQGIQTIIPNNGTFQTEDLDTYDSDFDDISNAKAVLMANISNYGSDVILEVPHSETYLNDMENQSVLAMQDFEQPPTVDFIDNEIHSDSNIILYS
nr:hypothetical protein [Tanacetum cinerariifolium]